MGVHSRQCWRTVSTLSAASPRSQFQVPAMTSNLLPSLPSSGEIRQAPVTLVSAFSSLATPPFHPSFCLKLTSETHFFRSSFCPTLVFLLAFSYSLLLLPTQPLLPLLPFVSVLLSLLSLGSESRSDDGWLVLWFFLYQRDLKDRNNTDII